MITAMFTDPRHAAHSDPTHVERAERLAAVHQAVDAAGPWEGLSALEPRPATDAQLATVHDPRLIAALKRACEQGGGRIDSDTYLTADSWEPATLAAGAAIMAAEMVVRGEARNAFALMRPPGHHATPRRSMGFCLLNNIALAARHATDTLGLERVAIVDYDVHHGNGTQDTFYADGRVLFCSIHSSMLYPGSGAVAEQGTGAGQGTTLNIPLPHGVGDQGYHQVMDALVAPALRHFRPQLILVSAGYDAHWSDPIGSEVLSVAGYGALTQSLVALAGELCGGKIALVLEGGYNLQALGACVVASLDALLDHAPRPDPLGAITAREPAVEPLIQQLRRSHPLFNWR
jgi:acetoin utilization deacetylase AcuC-like enzyme